jgi:hypothetical protein
LFGGGEGTDSGLESGEESLWRNRGSIPPAEISAVCLTGGGRTSRSIFLWAGGKEVDEFGLASCVMCKGRKGGANRA